ncbi:MAG: ABC transporter permease [Candidatus Hydrogenedentota bacterium]
MSYIEKLGRGLFSISQKSGEVIFLFLNTLLQTPFIISKRKIIIKQMVFCGIETIPVAIIVAIFSGMVIALQTGKELMKFQLQSQLGIVVAASMLREMGPVMTAIIVAGRVGAAMAAELGTMKVSEEIDALTVMEINPVRFLVMPRLVALLIMQPVLTIFSDIIGIAGGAVVSKYKIGISYQRFYNGAVDFVDLGDFYTGLVKSIVFAILIVVISCSEGLQAEYGSEGVGKAITRSVVLSFLFILIFDYFITYFFFGV